LGTPGWGPIIRDSSGITSIRTCPCPLSADRILAFQFAKAKSDSKDSKK